MSEQDTLKIAKSYFQRDYPILSDLVDGYLMKDGDVVIKFEDGRYYIYDPGDSSLLPYFV